MENHKGVSKPFIENEIRSRVGYFKKRYPAMDALAQGAIISLLHAQDQLFRRMTARLAGHGLMPPSFGVLMMLESSPERRMTMGDVSDRLIVTKANVTGLADTLEKRGLLEREADAKDRRKTWVRITPAGRRKLAALLPGHFEFCQRLMGALSAAEKKTFIGLCGKVMQGSFFCHVVSSPLSR